MKKKITIAAGGTGGHVFPAVCLANELRSRGYDIVFVTDKRGKKYLNDEGYPIVVQDINTSSRGKLYVSLIKSVLFSFFKLFKNKPDCVIGFGGYPSVPFVFASQLLGIKTIIHEQNAVIGKANKLLSKLATRIITSFNDTKYLNKTNKVVYIGNPTRFEKQYLNKKSNEKSDVLKILIFGGSQGAKIFSTQITDAICSIAKEKKIQIFQQARHEDVEMLRDKYIDNNIPHVVDNFFNNIDELYIQADLVISRSGASSIFEIIGFRKPAILIPYKKSINGDQEENARFLKRNRAAVVIDEHKDTNEDIFNIIKSAIEDSENLLDIEKSLDALFIPEITQKISDEVEKLVKTA